MRFKWEEGGMVQKDRWRGDIKAEWWLGVNIIYLFRRNEATITGPFLAPRPESENKTFPGQL